MSDKQLSAAEEYVVFCEQMLDNLRLDLGKGSNAYIFSDDFIDRLIAMKAFTIPTDPPFSHELHVKQIYGKIQEEIKSTPWIMMFNKKVSNRKNVLEEQRKERLAALKQPKIDLKYEDCEPGKYASYDKDGKKPSATFINAQLVLRDLGVVATFNEFTEKTTITLTGKDLDVGTIRNLMWDRVFVEFGERTVLQAMVAYCKRHAFHPIKDYFDTVKTRPSKGVLNNWLTKVLGAEDNELNREIGKKFFVAMVTRIYQPGAKFDQMIVFESEQGVGKSTLLEIISGREYFNSGKILTMSAKEQMEALKGRMIYEAAELVGSGKGDVDSVKAFLSMTCDSGRWAYASEVRDHPRTAIIVGTTNPKSGRYNYLLDDSGNRRIWPILCNVVPTDTVYEGKLWPKEANLPWLIENRDQLFAEAIALYDSGYSLVLDRNLWPDVAKIQESRLADIPYTDEVWQVFGLSAHEGLIIQDSPATNALQLRIWTKNIIASLFPNGIISNKVLGKDIKIAMNNLVVADKLKWQYKEQLKIDGLNNSGYLLTVSTPEQYQLIKSYIDGWRRQRQASGISNATL